MSIIKRASVDGKSRHFSGFKRQTVDTRDYLFKSSPLLMGTSVTCANLLQYNLPIVDQGNLGSCTSNAFAGLVGINELKAKKKFSFTNTQAKVKPKVTSVVSLSSDGKTLVVTNTITDFNQVTTTIAPTPPVPVNSNITLASRLYEYYNTRVIEGTVSEDSGASIRNTIKAAVRYGVTREDLWPYNISQFAVKPTQAVYSEALKHLVASYYSIANGDLASIKAAIVAGYGIEFGFDVYFSFLSRTVTSTGVVPMPDVNTETLVGGHAVVIVGFDDATQNFLVRNSWGTDWGLIQTGPSAPIFAGIHLTAPGYFLMPYAYVANTTLCSDFWVVISNVL